MVVWTNENEFNETEENLRLWEPRKVEVYFHRKLDVWLINEILLIIKICT